MSVNKYYPDFVKVTGYGNGGGLCGWNCRHNFIPFNPKTMKNNLKQYGLEENKKMYENHQKQRYFERNIRKYKKLCATENAAIQRTVDENTGIKILSKYNKHKILLKKWNNSYRRFSKEKNLKTQPERTKIAK